MTLEMRDLKYMKPSKSAAWKPTLISNVSHVIFLPTSPGDWVAIVTFHF